MANCIICCEKFNRSNHKKINCNYCNYECCSYCMEKYILSRPEHARCMNNDCKKIWNREVLFSKFTKKFVTTDYKKHRENLLFEQQKALMPQTQEYAELVKRQYVYKDERDKYMKEKLAEIKNLKQESEKLYLTVVENPDEVKLRIKLDEIKTRIHALDKTMRLMSAHYTRAINMCVNRNIHQVSKNKDTRKYIKNCPVSECKGFICNNWECGLCKIKICKDCHEIVEESEDDEENNQKHECKQEDIDTAKMIMEDTKPCPNCAVRIHKIVGCDQMYCTSCNTAFSWKTGNIETGVIHNPHYYEFLNRNGRNQPRFRNLGDQICGGMINYQLLSTLIDKIYPDYRVSNDKSKYPVVLKYIDNIYRLYFHIMEVTMRNYVINAINDMRDDRVEYMLNRKTEQEFKMKLQKYEKEIDKSNDIRMLLEMFQNTTIDIFRKIEVSQNKEELENNFDELSNLKSYFNSESEKIAKRYQSLSLNISKTWDAIYNYK